MSTRILSTLIAGSLLIAAMPPAANAATYGPRAATAVGSGAVAVGGGVLARHVMLHAAIGTHAGHAAALGAFGALAVIFTAGGLIAVDLADKASGQDLLGLGGATCFRCPGYMPATYR